MLTEATRYKLKLEYENGLGFQYPNPPGTRAPICVLNKRFYTLGEIGQNPNYEELIQKVRAETNASTLDWYYAGGRPIVSVDWCDQSKVEQILDTLVKLNLNFQLATKEMPQFGYVQKDTKFSFDMIEQRLCQSLQSGIDHIPLRICEHLWKHSPLADIWNWKTPSGIAMCKKLRTHLSLPEQHLDDPGNFRNWLAYVDFETWAQNNTTEWLHIQ